MTSYAGEVAWRCAEISGLIKRKGEYWSGGEKGGGSHRVVARNV